MPGRQSLYSVSERSQKIQQILFLLLQANHGIRFRAVTGMVLNRYHQTAVGGSRVRHARKIDAGRDPTTVLCGIHQGRPSLAKYYRPAIVPI